MVNFWHIVIGAVINCNNIMLITNSNCCRLWQDRRKTSSIPKWFETFGRSLEVNKSVSSHHAWPVSFESHRVKVTLGEEDVSCCCSFHHPCLAWSVSVSVLPRPIGSYNVDHMTWPRPITARVYVARQARAEETDSHRTRNTSDSPLLRSHTAHVTGDG